MAPQIIYLVLVLIALLAAANSHGKMEKRPKSFWISLVSIAVQAGLMYWGGFFNVFFGK